MGTFLQSTDGRALPVIHIHNPDPSKTTTRNEAVGGGYWSSEVGLSPFMFVRRRRFLMRHDDVIVSAGLGWTGTRSLGLTWICR